MASTDPGSVTPVPAERGPWLDCGGRALDLSRITVMGILNVTPDSFSDGGRFTSVAAAVDRAWQMVDEGAGLVDVGGESTRPGSRAVSASEELARVVPVIRVLGKELPVPISIDTSKPEVMRAAVDAGAGLINDVLALRAEGSLEAAAAARVPVCLMHMQGLPRTMQDAPRYADVVSEVAAFLADRLERCEAAGIERHRILLDPGFGFGKTLAHNLELLAGLDDLAALGRPLLVGLSRKSMIGQVLDLPVDERLPGSLALAAVAVMKGARIIRAHDVRPTAEVVTLVQAVLDAAERRSGSRGETEKP